MTPTKTRMDSKNFFIKPIFNSKQDQNSKNPIFWNKKFCTFIAIFSAFLIAKNFVVSFAAYMQVKTHSPRT